jgi:hypothetical protein
MRPTLWSPTLVPNDGGGIYDELMGIVVGGGAAAAWRRRRGSGGGGSSGSGGVGV